MDGNHKLKLNLVRKHSHYSDPIRLMLIVRETTSESKRLTIISLNCLERLKITMRFLIGGNKLSTTIAKSQKLSTCACALRFGMFAIQSKFDTSLDIG